MIAQLVQQHLQRKKLTQEVRVLIERQDHEDHAEGHRPDSPTNTGKQSQQSLREKLNLMFRLMNKKSQTLQYSVSTILIFSLRYTILKTEQHLVLHGTQPLISKGAKTTQNQKPLMPFSS
jgi:hypothetical protein